MQESTLDEIELKGHGNLKKEIFEPILKYIYSGNMEVGSRENDTIMEILSEALFFSMSELVDEILAYLKESNKDNRIQWVFQMLPFAEKHSNNKLKEECFKELEVDPDTAIKDDETMNLSAKTLKELISRNSFWALEEHIAFAVINWAKKNKPRVPMPLNSAKEWPEVASLARAVRLSQLNESSLEALRRYFPDEQVLDAMFLRKYTSHRQRRDRGLPGKIQGHASSNRK